MIGRLADWPALEGVDLGGGSLRMHAERAIWGKADGVPTDFRWLGCSPNIELKADRLELRLSLGDEDVPLEGSAWRALPERFCAVRFYPSRASDAAGRAHFLEKQILEWRSEATLPAAAGALALLPQAARLNDEEWWATAGDRRWVDERFTISLPALEFEVTEESILQELVRACTQLRNCLDNNELELARIFSMLLMGQRALLGPRGRPLAGLAALLLPFPRFEAELLSVASWVPSRTWPKSEHWDVLAASAPAPVLSEPATSAVQARALAMARSVLAIDPAHLRSAPATGLGRGGLRALARAAERCGRAVPGAAGGSPAAEVLRVWSLDQIASEVRLLRELPDWTSAVEHYLGKLAPRSGETVSAVFSWARDHQELMRWTAVWIRSGGSAAAFPREVQLSPAVRAVVSFALDRWAFFVEPVKLINDTGGGWHTLDASSPEVRVLLACVQRVRDEAAGSRSPRGWRVKEHVVRAAALALAPGAETAELLRSYDCEEVAPLLFAAQLPQGEWDALGNLGLEMFRAAIALSGKCARRRDREEIRRWLYTWSGGQGELARWLAQILPKSS